MAERGENAVVRNAQMALKFLGSESNAAVEQVLIGPRGVANLSEEHLFGEGHRESINVSENVWPISNTTNAIRFLRLTTHESGPRAIARARPRYNSSLFHPGKLGLGSTALLTSILRVPPWLQYSIYI